MPNKGMAQKDFIAKLKAEVPEFENFNDNVIMNEVFKRRPELRDKIENPLLNDATAAKAQQNTLMEKQKNQAFTKSAIDSLPGLGSVVGGAVAAPETMGAGSIPGMALGAGVGRGLRDIIAHLTGIEDSSPVSKAANIGMETGIAALTPGVVDIAKHPIDAARMGIEEYARLAPPKMRGWVIPQILEDIINSGKPKIYPSPINYENIPTRSGRIVPEGFIKNGENVFEGEVVNPKSSNSSSDSKSVLDRMSGGRKQNQIGPAKTIFADSGAGPVKSPLNPPVDNPLPGPIHPDIKFNFDQKSGKTIGELIDDILSKDNSIDPSTVRFPDKK